MLLIYYFFDLSLRLRTGGTTSVSKAFLAKVGLPGPTGTCSSVTFFGFGLRPLFFGAICSPIASVIDSGVGSLIASVVISGACSTIGSTIGNFEPIEVDLENPIQEQITSLITNSSCNTKGFKSFFLFSWDVGRPGLWYSIEPCSSRDQFKEVTRWWPKGVGNGQRSQSFATLSRDKQQGRSAYFQSVYSNKVYYGKILAFGTYKSCLQELKKFEDWTLKYPLTVYEYMVPEANLVYLLHGLEYKSCRSEVVVQSLKFEESYAKFFPVDKPIQQKRRMSSDYDANSIEKRRKIV